MLAIDFAALGAMIIFTFRYKSMNHLAFIVLCDPCKGGLVSRVVDADVLVLDIMGNFTKVVAWVVVFRADMVALLFLYLMERRSVM